MSTKPVALESMITAIVGTVPYPPAVSGSWTAGTIINTKVIKLSVDGNKVVKKAECTFTFTGVDSIGNPVSGSSKVTLNASTTVLTDNSDNLLVLGDSANDSYGNTLIVSSGQNKLRTA